MRLVGMMVQVTSHHTRIAAVASEVAAAALFPDSSRGIHLVRHQHSWAHGAKMFLAGEQAIPQQVLWYGLHRHHTSCPMYVLRIWVPIVMRL